MTRVKVVTAADLRAELEGIYDRYPLLREEVTDCCGGCAEQQVADLYGWGPATDAWNRAESVRYLLGESA